MISNPLMERLQAEALDALLKSCEFYQKLNQPDKAKEAAIDALELSVGLPIHRKGIESYLGGLIYG